MIRSLLFSIFVLLFFGSCKHSQGHSENKGPSGFPHHGSQPRQPDRQESVQRICFASCAHQDKDQPLLDTALARNPDLFIYLGDNIYGDSRDLEKLREKYKILSGKPEFQRLWDSVPVLATWDDHDYGENDAGRHYPLKEKSKELFLDFWAEPLLSSRRLHPGIYHSEEFGPPSKRVQVILLDTRSFRDDILHEKTKLMVKRYGEVLSPDSTFLGHPQWRWLEDQLKKPAKLRIIASSNQFSHEHNGFESWTNMPHERNRMLSLIRETEAEGVVFISGDVHYGELSVIRSDSLFPIYDLTSSGLTQTWTRAEPNQNRVGEVCMENNLGMLEINWDRNTIRLLLTGLSGKVYVQEEISLDSLKF